MEEGSTQSKRGSTVSISSFKTWQAKIIELGQQVHAIKGAKHKNSKEQELPSSLANQVHQLGNNIEAHRKRLKWVEDAEGTSKCVTMLKQLQADVVRLNTIPNPAFAGMTATPAPPPPTIANNAAAPSTS